MLRIGTQRGCRLHASAAAENAAGCLVAASVQTAVADGRRPRFGDVEVVALNGFGALWSRLESDEILRVHSEYVSLITSRMMWITVKMIV